MGENTVAGVVVEVDGAVLRITLDKPDSLNAVNAEMLWAVENALSRHELDDSIRCVVLTGRGRAFCSGADLGGGAAVDAKPTPATLDAANAVVGAIRRFRAPVIAVTRGPVAGVGVSLALVCDLVISADDAFFLLAFTKIGLMPDGGATALVAASIGRARAMQMALLAPRISAAQALEWGLIAFTAPADELDATAEGVIQQIVAGPALAFRETKFAVNEATLGGLEDALRYERAGQARLIRSEDFAEGTTAFREKRAANFTGR